jgi:hypothetical protein
MAVGIRCADHATSYIRKKLALYSPTCGGRSVDIIRLRTKATEFSFIYRPIFNFRLECVATVSAEVLKLIVWSSSRLVLVHS